MDGWQSFLIEQQINAAISLILMVLKDKKWVDKFRPAVLKIVKVAKVLYPDADEFK